MKKATVIGIFFILLMAAILSGCGEDRGSATTGLNPQSGSVILGPVSGATVFADKLDSGVRFVKDNNEVSATSDGNGKYTLPLPEGYGKYELVSQGGTDTLFSKPAIQLRAKSSSKNITALTTLVAINPELQTLIEALGVGYDDNISENVTPAALLLAKSIESIVSILNDSINKKIALTPEQKSDTQNAIFSAIADQLAKPGTTADSVTNLASLKALINDATLSAITKTNSTYSDVQINNAQTTAASITAVLNTVANAINPAGNFSKEDKDREDKHFESDERDDINQEIEDRENDIDDDVVNPDKTPPTIIDRFPAPNATGVPLDVIIRVTFSEPMDPESITGSSTSSKRAGKTVFGNAEDQAITLRKASNGELVPGVVTYNVATRTASFDPNNLLLPNTTYIVTVSTEVTDLAGNHLAAPSSWSFTTIVITGSGGGD